MLVRLLHHFLSRRHFWRNASFSEIAELYASTILRYTAVSMVSVLAAVFLLRSGYSVVFVLGYFSVYFMFRAITGWPAARLVARFGPKHGALISNFIYIPALLALAMLPTWGIYALIIVAPLQALSTTLYEISHEVNMSKVNHPEHAGKELGYMFTLTRIATTISPLFGGIIASLFGPQAVVILASLLFMVAAAPSFISAEPVAIHQYVKLRTFPWQTMKRLLLARLGAGADLAASGSLWAIFVAVVVFAKSGNEIYAQIGALSSVSVIGSVLFAHLYGVIIDRRHGHTLMIFGVGLNSLVHMIRPFVFNPYFIAPLNIANEVATTAYNMPTTKGMYDLADSLPGQRISFLVVMSIAASIGSCLFLGGAMILAYAFGDLLGLQLSYVAVALITLSIGAYRFRS